MIIISVFVFLGCFLFGLIFLDTLRIKSFGIEKIAISLVIGPLLFIWVNFLLSFLFSFNKLTVYFSFLLIVLFFLLFFSRKQAKLNLKTKKINRKKLFLIVKKNLFLLISIFIFSSLFFLLSYFHSLYREGLYYISSKSNFGDLPFHLNIISSLVHGANFPLENPIFSNTRLYYPFLVDFFSAQLIYLGLTLRESLVLPELVFSTIIFILFFCLAKRITKNNLGAFFSSLIFFFSGGFGLYYSLKNSHVKNFSTLIKYFLKTEVNFTHLDSRNIKFANIISNQIYPERSLLLGLPISLIIIILLEIFAKEKNKNYLFLAILLFCLLPLIHIHSFLFLSLYFLFNFFRNKKAYFKNLPKMKWYLLIPISFLAIQFIWYFPRLVSLEGFLRIKFGWTWNNKGNLILYWLKNTGLILPLVLTALIYPKLSQKTKIFYLPFLTIFFVANIFQFQPFLWDNIKFFLFAHLGSSILIGLFLAKLFKKRELKYLVGFLLFFQILSGFLSIISEIKTRQPIYSLNDFQMAEKIKEKTSPKLVFLTYSSFNNPIAALAGRKLFLGYAGLLWVHGIKYHYREIVQEKIYSGDVEAKKLIKENGINYVFLGQAEKANFKINFDFLSQFPKTIETKNWTIYNVREYDD